MEERWYIEMYKMVNLVRSMIFSNNGHISGPELAVALNNPRYESMTEDEILTRLDRIELRLRAI